VLDIIDRIEPHPDRRLEELVGLLRWLRCLNTQARAEPEIVQLLIETILTGTTDCVLGELNRLYRQGTRYLGAEIGRIT